MIDKSNLVYNLLDVGLMGMREQTHMMTKDEDYPLKFEDLEYKTSIYVATPEIYRTLLAQASIKPGHGMMLGRTNALVFIALTVNICTQIDDPGNTEAIELLQKHICAHMNDVPDWKLFVGMRN